MHREILFKKIPDGFRVKERVNGMLESVHNVSFEYGFRRISELKNEGFVEEKFGYESPSTDRDYLFVYQSEQR